MDADASLRSLLVVMVIAHATYLCSSLAADDVATISDIQSAWEARAATFQTLRIEWTNEQLFRKGTFSSSPFGQRPAGVEPTRDLVVDSSRMMIYDHGRMRSVREGSVYGPDDTGGRSFAPMEFIQCWDGKLSRSAIIPFGRPGTVSIRRADDRFTDSEICILFAAMGFEQPQFLSLDKFRLEGPLEVTGKRYLQLTKKKPQPVDTAEIWLQPNAPYLLVKMISKGGGVTFAESEIEYAEDRDGHVYPSRWSRVIYNAAGGVDTWTKSKTTSFQLNPPINDEDFTIRIPADAYIHDETIQERKPE